MPQIQHQPATLYAPKQGTWRFDWYNFNPESNQLQRVRKTFNINRIRDLKQRKSIANSILSQLNQALSNGFNYFVQTNAISENTIETKGEEGISLIAALHRITTIRLLGKEDKTRNCYRSFVNTFENWLKETDQSRMALHEFADTIFYNFLNYKKAKGHGNRNLNDYIGYFKFCFAKLKKLYKLPTNPLEDIDMLPVHASTLFQALTETELAAIKTRLIKDNIRYYCYTLFTAHEYIRPYHIAFIKRSDIDFENSTITINSTSSKNKKVKVKSYSTPFIQPSTFNIQHNHLRLLGKVFMKIRNRLDPFVKISEIKFFIGRMKIVAIKTKAHKYDFNSKLFFKD